MIEAETRQRGDDLARSVPNGDDLIWGIPPGSVRAGVADRTTRRAGKLAWRNGPRRGLAAALAAVLACAVPISVGLGLLLALGAPEARAQSGPFVYVPNLGDNTVSVIDTPTNTVGGSAIGVANP